MYRIEVCGLESSLEENQRSKRNRLCFEFSTVESLEISTIFFSRKVRDEFVCSVTVKIIIY